nr:MAG TPA: hypothetical protein [Caudoviricetes sp.]
MCPNRARKGKRAGGLQCLPSRERSASPGA